MVNSICWARIVAGPAELPGDFALVVSIGIGDTQLERRVIAILLKEEEIEFK